MSPVQELADRFGPISDPVDNLLYQLRVKVLAGRAGVSIISIEGGQIRIKLPGLENIPRMQLQRHLNLNGGVRVSRTAIWFNRDLSTNEWKVALVQVLERLQTFRQAQLSTAQPV